MVEPRIVEADEDVGGNRVHIDSEYEDEETVNKKARMRESIRVPPIRDATGKVQLAKVQLAKF